MKIISRLSYLKRLIQTIQTPDIKVITGIRIVDIADWLRDDESPAYSPFSHAL